MSETIPSMYSSPPSWIRSPERRKSRRLPSGFRFWNWKFWMRPFCCTRWIIRTRSSGFTKRSSPTVVRPITSSRVRPTTSRKASFTSASFPSVIRLRPMARGLDRKMVANRASLS
jgi:hypothetical protein